MWGPSPGQGQAISGQPAGSRRFGCTTTTRARLAAANASPHASREAFAEWRESAVLCGVPISGRNLAHCSGGFAEACLLRRKYAVTIGAARDEEAATRGGRCGGSPDFYAAARHRRDIPRGDGVYASCHRRIGDASAPQQNLTPRRGPSSPQRTKRTPPHLARHQAPSYTRPSPPRACSTRSRGAAACSSSTES